MKTALRRGACPTLAEPMTTGDGLLARLNPVSGGIAPATLAAIARAAARFGNGLLEVTSRGSLQIRGLTPSSAPQLAEAADRLDIKVRSGVPVETGPLAGLDPQEIADPTPLAEKIRERITEAGLSARLGPKVSVVVDGGGRLGLNTVLADIRLEAVRVDGLAFWRVAIGGTSEGARLLGVVEAETACKVAIALLEAVAAKGHTARARELKGRDLSAIAAMLVSDWEMLRPTLLPSVLPDILTAIATLPLADGRIALGVGLPFGQATAEQTIAFADAATRQGADEIRFAPGRALLALCPTAAAADALKNMAAASGFVTGASDPRLAVVACAGAPACASGHLPARAIAAEIAAGALPDITGLVHVSGCAKQCARPAHAAFTLIGTAEACEIHHGDGLEGPPDTSVANDDAAAAFGRVARLYRNDKKTGEEPPPVRDGREERFSATIIGKHDVRI